MNYLKNRGVLLSFIILFVNVGNSVAAAKAEINLPKTITLEQSVSARSIVHDFQSELLKVMKQGKELGFQGRFKQLEPAILKSHDLAKIVRIVVGKEWKHLSDEQKKTLTDIFTRLSISAYALNFKEFSGESFVYQSEDETARGGIIVHTALELPKKKDVKLDYMLKKKGGNWRIINIIANGVSDLALKRSEYTSILKRKGFEALIAKISEKIDNYAKQ